MLQVDSMVKQRGWSVQQDLIVLPRNEMNSPVVVKRAQVSLSFCSCSQQHNEPHGSQAKTG